MSTGKRQNCTFVFFVCQTHFNKGGFFLKQITSSLQWFLFIVSGSIVVPIAIASLYHLDPPSMIGFISRTFLVLALAGLLQISFGHGLPINEGPAGLWWGIFVLYASLGVTLYGSANETLRVLEFALLISGVISMILGVTGAIDKLASYFTPAVTGTYLLLLIAQLSGSFLKGMLGIDLTGKVSIQVTVLSIVIIVLSYFMTRNRFLNQFSIIASMSIGWLLFALFGYTDPIHFPEKVFTLPKLFAFGWPSIDWGIVPTVFFVTLLLITNMLASIKVVEKVLKVEGENSPAPSMKKSGLMMGISQMLGGIFGAIGPVPISGAAGFIATSKITRKLPFILASFLILLISFFPGAISFFASLPTAVGYAAIFPVFSGLIILGLREIFSSENVEKAIGKVSIPLFVGIGVMFVPPDAFSSLPPIAASIMSNGLVLGTVIALIFEIVGKQNA